MASVFSKIWNFLKGLVTRPGLQQFLAKYLPAAVNLIGDLATVNSNVEFHLWKDRAFRELKSITGEVRDNWIAIAIHLAYEEWKAKQSQ